MTAGACKGSLQRARSGVEAGRVEAACQEQEAGSAAQPGLRRPPRQRDLGLPSAPCASLRLLKLTADIRAATHFA
jgi:hypothetical protein